MGRNRPVSGARTRKGFRLDIQGVRGFALVLVLACHAEVPGFAGGFVGLDVFYVLSGFLITGLILTELDRRGDVSIGRFYARRAKRLLPLAVTVLAFVVVCSALLYSPLQNQKVSGDVLSAALYVVNWHFIAESVDYFAFHNALISPVQHYWSLSVEEQFYLLWPLTLGVGAGLARWRGWSMRRTIALLVVPLGVASLVYSVGFTPEHTRAAYFSTLTRMWELAMGGVLALVLPAGLDLPRRVSALLAGAGLATLVAHGADLHRRHALSGLASPAADAGDGGDHRRRHRRRRLRPDLAAQPRAAAVPGQDLLRLVPLALADPRLRRRALAPLAARPRARHARLVGAGGAHPPHDRGALPPLAQPRAAAEAGARPRRDLHARRRLPRDRPAGVEPAGADRLAGTGARGDGDRAAQPAPAAGRRAAAEPPGAAADKGALWDDGCVLLHDETESPPCVYGAKNSPKTVVAFGDSHAEQWFPPLIKLANRRRWRLIGLVRAGCVVGDVQYERACDAWRRNEMRRIVTEERPDMVVVGDSTGGRYQIVRNGQRLDRRRSEPFLIAGFARTLRKLKRNGAKVVVIRDQPLAPFEPPDCVSQNLHQLSKCTFLGRRKRWHAYDFFGARRVPGVKLIDPIDILCPRHRCPSVMGRVLVYRNTYHLSATFARTLTPWLGRELPEP